MEEVTQEKLDKIEEITPDVIKLLERVLDYTSTIMSDKDLELMVLHAALFNQGCLAHGQLKFCDMMDDTTEYFRNNLPKESE